MENYVLYHPKDTVTFTLAQSEDYLRLQHELETKGCEYEIKEWGRTFDQVNCDYVPTIRVYEHERFVDYTVDYFNTFDKIKAGHFKEI